MTLRMSLTMCHKSGEIRIGDPLERAIGNPAPIIPIHNPAGGRGSWSQIPLRSDARPILERVMSPRSEPESSFAADRRACYTAELFDRSCLIIVPTRCCRTCAANMPPICRLRITHGPAAELPVLHMCWAGAAELGPNLAAKFGQHRHTLPPTGQYIEASVALPIACRASIYRVRRLLPITTVA